MSNEFNYDVFISYSSRDQEWVRGELLRRIQEAGLKAFIDCQDCRPGGASIAECERGVRESRKALLILTPHYLESSWCRAEANMIQTLDPDNSTGRLIPVLKRACEKPLRIAALSHIDFAQAADLEQSWRQLLTALGTTPQPTPVEEADHADWFLAHPYAMPPNFTGRMAERKLLSDWLERDVDHPLLVIRALGGFGKSALIWHWLMHDVQRSHWPRVVWWSFYEMDAAFDRFLERGLGYLKPGDPAQLGARQRLEGVLAELRKAGTLLVLDGFERELRAFGGFCAAYQGDVEKREQRHEGIERDCLSPVAELFLRGIASLPGVKGRVLLTTRLRPTIVETREGILLQGCREVELTQLHPTDAVEFFHQQGVRGGRAEIQAACAPYGYHPLSLRLLAGWIISDFQQPGDIAVTKRLDVSGDLVQRQHHVLDQAYDRLTPGCQTLLGRIACFRGVVKYDALKAVAEAESKINQQGGVTGFNIAATTTGSSPAPLGLDADLRDLVSSGLLHHDRRNNRFDLHPIVRRYAYDRLAAPDRTAAHTRLQNYFAGVPEPEKVRSMDDLAPVIELYHHAVHAGHHQQAWEIFLFRLARKTYYQFAAYQLQIDLLLGLFPEGEEKPPRLLDPRFQGFTINTLANSLSRSGNPHRALRLFEKVNKIDEQQGDKLNLAIGWGNLAVLAQIPIGALRAAEVKLRGSIKLCVEIADRFQEGFGHQDLGKLLKYRGVWAESKRELAIALKLFETKDAWHEQCAVWLLRAQRELLIMRQAALAGAACHRGNHPKSTITFARRALELAANEARDSGPNERDYVHAQWVLGAAHRAAGRLKEAERHLNEALDRCRRINMVDTEADILIDLARLRNAIGAPDEAKKLAGEEALIITERCGYVLQGADAHLVLAELAKARDERPALLHHATEAKRLATCDGPPDYTYKVAYDEACALLAEIS